MRDLIAIAIIVMVVLLLALPSMLRPAKAQTPPTSDNCEQIATVGLLEVFQCVNESDGSEFMVNSFGFMYPVE